MTRVGGLAHNGPRVGWGQGTCYVAYTPRAGAAVCGCMHGCVNVGPCCVWLVNHQRCMRGARSPWVLPASLTLSLQHSGPRSCNSCSISRDHWCTCMHAGTGSADAGLSASSPGVHLRGVQGAIDVLSYVICGRCRCNRTCGLLCICHGDVTRRASSSSPSGLHRHAALAPRSWSSWGRDPNHHFGL